MAESLLLALIGGALGLVLSLWFVEGLTALLPADVPQLSGLTPDWRVLMFTVGAAMLTGLLCGLFPAITATRAAASPTPSSQAGMEVAAPTGRFARAFTQLACGRRSGFGFNVIGRGRIVVE